MQAHDLQVSKHHGSGYSSVFISVCIERVLTFTVLINVCQMSKVSQAVMCQIPVSAQVRHTACCSNGKH